MSKRFLFLLPPRLGDALMLSPALALLKKLQPQSFIDILSLSKLAASVYKNNPNCRQIYVVSEVEDINQHIESYDLLIAAHRDSKILQLTERLNKPLLLTDPPNLEIHQAQQAVDFIQYIFSDLKEKAAYEYELYPTEKEKVYIAELLNTDKKYLGFHLGCHGQNKKNISSFFRKNDFHEKVWPLKSFIALGKLLRQKYPEYQIILTGGENELNLANEFLKHISDAINLVGKTDVLQLAALMQKLSLYVCADTGTMHVACAMKTPLVALFGPTNSIRTGPYPITNFRKVIKTGNLQQLDLKIVLEAIEKFIP